MGNIVNTFDGVVDGGGVAGLSTAMQLASRGLGVIVLERQQLGSGSTGRAVGLLGQLRGTAEHTRMLLESAAQRLPWIRPRTSMHVTTGIMTFTPDAKPLCGKTCDIDGLYHCTGFSGHGIVQSPTIGVNYGRFDCQRSRRL